LLSLCLTLHRTWRRNTGSTKEIELRFGLKKTFRSFRRDEEGVTLVEYGVALMLAVTVGTITLTGLAGDVRGEMDTACVTISGAAC